MDSYQAIYDAVRSRITGADLGDIFERAVRQGMDVSHQVACVAQEFSIAEALISAYKAELLKEVSDPIAYYDPDLDCGSAGISFDPLSDGIGLYTSDQLAAAVARATKPLEDSLAVVKKDRADLYMETLTLRDQLAKTEQLWQVAQGRCDGLEEKLAKAEQRVAEACALQVATETRFHRLDAARVAKEIRSSE